MGEMDTNALLAQYGALGQTDVPPQTLTALLQECRSIDDPQHNTLWQTRGALCMELAAMTSRPQLSASLLNEAETCMDESIALEPASQRQCELQIRSQVYRAFMPRYRQAYVDRKRTNLDDEASHFERLTTVMASAETILNESTPIMPAEIATHALVAHNNLVKGAVLWRSWPAMPRHRQFEARSHTAREDWSIGLSPGDFDTDTRTRQYLVRFRLGGKLRRAEGRSAERLVALEEEGLVSHGRTLIRSLAAETRAPEPHVGEQHLGLLALQGDWLVKRLARIR